MKGMHGSALFHDSFIELIEQYRKGGIRNGYPAVTFDDRLYARTLSYRDIHVHASSLVTPAIRHGILLVRRPVTIAPSTPAPTATATAATPIFYLPIRPHRSLLRRSHYHKAH